MDTTRTAWVYLQTEPSPDTTSPRELWTVGHYSPDGTWHPESDHRTSCDAAARVHWLNGGQSKRKF